MSRVTARLFPINWEERRAFFHKLGYRFSITESEVTLSLNDQVVSNDKLSPAKSRTMRLADAWLIGLTRADSHMKFGAYRRAMEADSGSVRALPPGRAQSVSDLPKPPYPAGGQQSQ